MKKKIFTANAPKAIGPYSQAVMAGDFLYISGQIPLCPVTGEVVGSTAPEQAVQVFKNLEAILTEAGMTFDNAVKTTVLLADIADFAAVNEVYAQYFDDPYPARSCVQVGALPKGAEVEIECLVIDTSRYEQQSCSGNCSGCQGCD